MNKNEIALVSFTIVATGYAGVVILDKVKTNLEERKRKQAAQAKQMENIKEHLNNMRAALRTHNEMDARIKNGEYRRNHEAIREDYAELYEFNKIAVRLEK